MTTEGSYTFNTESTTLSGTNDTELGLYSSLGALIALDDDSGTGNLSLITQTLSPGDYYLAAGAFNKEFGSPFNVVSTSGQTGNLIINGITAVPEPTFLALAGLAVTGLTLRRSRVTGRYSLRTRMNGRRYLKVACRFLLQSLIDSRNLPPSHATHAASLRYCVKSHRKEHDHGQGQQRQEEGSQKAEEGRRQEGGRQEKVNGRLVDTNTPHRSCGVFCVD